jgi:DNA-binding NtrC family response regulator
LIVRGPDGRLEQTIELSDAAAALFGRDPDPQTLQRSGDDGGRAVRVVAVAAPSVSANHALAWREGDAVCIRDLGSRNGSLLLLPRGRTVTFNGDEDAVLYLAQSSDGGGGADEPAPPQWTGRADFATALAAALAEWLQRRHTEVRVAVVAKSSDNGDQPGRVPLATGEALDIVPLQTVDASWSQILEQLWRWVARQNRTYETEQDARDEGMILASPAIRAAHREVVEAARTGARTLLLTGPSGAGKERLAEAFHRSSGRTGPFVAVNCSMFNREMLRSELFGAEAGSFTGATRRIIGAVERAHGGTLFLDEIGELAADVQPMLLRFLDRHEYERMGQYGKVQRADVRVVAATNRDLRAAAGQKGGFRADLWFRLSVHVVEVPPLRARREDLLAYLQSVVLDGGHALAEALTPAARELLLAHAWDGNFRELTNFAERMPRDALPSSIDATACRRALERGALHPLAAPAPSLPPQLLPVGGAWATLAERAVHSFLEDHGHEPRTWDDQKECTEKYLKPLLFFELSGAAAHPVPVDATALAQLASRVANVIQADRGTALKQLTRYFERFATR